MRLAAASRCPSARTPFSFLRVIRACGVKAIDLEDAAALTHFAATISSARWLRTPPYNSIPARRTQRYATLPTVVLRKILPEWKRSPNQVYNFHPAVIRVRASTRESASPAELLNDVLTKEQWHDGFDRDHSGGGSEIAGGLSRSRTCSAEFVCKKGRSLLDTLPYIRGRVRREKPI
jgi:hypothetical protein